MKYDVLERLMRQLREKNTYHNDGKGGLYRYDHDRGIWVPLDALAGRQYLSVDTKEPLRLGDRDELLRELQEDVSFTATELSEEKPTSFIVANNGVVDLKTGDLKPLEPQLFLHTYMNFTYKKGVKELPEDNAWFDFAKNSLGIPNVNRDGTYKWKVFLEAMIYALSGLPNAKKMVVLLGPPNCGKSVVLEFLQRIVGDNSWMPMTFADMGQRFRGSLMEKAQLLTCDEMPVKPLKNLDMVKRIISGNPVIIEQKGANPKKYKPRAKIVFAANQLPTLGEPDVGGAFAERLLPILFAKRDNGTDPDLIEKLWADRDIFLSLAVQVMPAFIQRNLLFSQDAKSEQILSEFKARGFSLETYINEFCIPKAGNRLCLADFYSMYKDFCNESLYVAIPKTELKTALAQLGYVCQRQRISGYPNARQCIIGLGFKEDNTEYASSEMISAEQPDSISGEEV